MYLTRAGNHHDGTKYDDIVTKTHTRQPETELCVMTGIIEQMESEENWRMAAQADLNREEI